MLKHALEILYLLAEFILAILVWTVHFPIYICLILVGLSAWLPERIAHRTNYHASLCQTPHYSAIFFGSVIAIALGVAIAPPANNGAVLGVICINAVNSFILTAYRIYPELSRLKDVPDEK